MVVLALSLILALAGCGGGYEDANRSIVEELPTLEAVTLLEEDHYGYCSGDTCLLGNDRSGALLSYTVDVERYTQRELAEAYGETFDDWEVTIEEGCLSADPDDCEQLVIAYFVRGDERIDLNLDNWPAGRFEIHIDAMGGS